MKSTYYYLHFVYDMKMVSSNIYYFEFLIVHYV